MKSLRSRKAWPEGAKDLLLVRPGSPSFYPSSANHHKRCTRAWETTLSWNQFYLLTIRIGLNLLGRRPKRDRVVESQVSKSAEPGAPGSAQDDRVEVRINKRPRVLRAGLRGQECPRHTGCLSRTTEPLRNGVRVAPFRSGSLDRSRSTWPSRSLLRRSA